MEEECIVVLTKPYFSSEAEDSVNKYRPPNLMRRAFSILQNIRFGADLSRVQLPAHFNILKSHLQFYGETVYGVRSEFLEKCNRGKSSIERLIAVIAWNTSTLHPMAFGSAPFNSILGETHHVSRGSLNVLLEQVSHHPPCTALHATDEEENLEVNWCQNLDAKFCGTSIQLVVNGTRQLKLHNHKETYEISSSKLLIKLFPLPRVEATGTLKFRCQESGLEAELIPQRSSLLRLDTNPKGIKGKIIDSSSRKTLFTVDGRWDKALTATDLSTGETRVIYDAIETVTGLKAPIVKDPQGIWASESTLVWSEVSKYILKRDWGKATEIKRAIEENQRKLVKERKSRDENWTPKHFVVNYSKENGWDCSPIQRLVPPAPIVVP